MFPAYFRIDYNEFSNISLHMQCVLIFHLFCIFINFLYNINSFSLNINFFTGDNYKHVRVGQLCTPVGTIHLSVSYRTKMTISPTHKGRDSIMLKSDHFHSDLSPRHTRYQQRSVKYLKVYDAKYRHILIVLLIKCAARKRQNHWATPLKLVHLY